MPSVDLQPTPELQPSASYSLTIRLELSGRPGTLGRVTTAIGEAGGDIDAIDIVRAGRGVVVRDITVACRDEVNLQDIAAPRCFEVEERLRQRLDIPVMHDDQHGTAVVVLAAMKNALALVG